MLKQFKIDLKLQMGSILANLVAELGGFLFGFLLVNLIMRVDDDPGSWFCMGTLMALIVGAMFVFFAGSFGYSSEFQVAVAMGRTRKAFMGSYALRLLMQLLADYVVLLGLYQLELAIYPLLFPAFGNEVVFSFLTDWRVLPPCVLGLLILAMFIGALYGSYGRKGLWAFYLLWLFGCFVLPRVFSDELGSGVLDQAALGVRTAFQTIPLAAWGTMGTVLAVGMVTTTILLGRRQMVKL